MFGGRKSEQIKLRTDRINAKNEHCFILSETQTQKSFIKSEKSFPMWLLSIQYKR